MAREQLADFLYLFHRFGSQQSRLRALLSHNNDDPFQARQAIDAEPHLFNPHKPRTSPEAQMHVDLEWAEAPNNHLIWYGDPAYPALLGQTPGYPLMLYASGDISLLDQPQIAIVGSRNCTPGGARNARDFAAELANAGLVITSGLALGVDSEAHEGALSQGKTIAVTATGLDLVYPRQNRRLASRIRDCGLLISEFPLGTHARAAFFPQRNRIICGLAIATLVVEAAQRSGSLITARLAGEQGRDVFAIPGSIHNPQSRGCHQLLRDGATLAETPVDIIRELEPLFRFVISEQNPTTPVERISPDDDKGLILNAVGFDPTCVDSIIESSGLTVDKVSSMLVLLELEALIQTAPGGCYVRT